MEPRFVLRPAFHGVVRRFPNLLLQNLFLQNLFFEVASRWVQRRGDFRSALPAERQVADWPQQERRAVIPYHYHWVRRAESRSRVRRWTEPLGRERRDTLPDS